jgi:chromosome segregation ATPase
VTSTIDTERPPPRDGGLPPRRRRTRWLRLGLTLMAGALFASTLGYLIDDQVAEHEHLDQVRVALTLTRHRSAEVTRDLTQLRHDITLLTAQVAANSATWNQDQGELKAASTALAITQADVSQQSSRITALHTCLGGVQQALNALAVNDQPSAIAALHSVSSSCAAASSG